MIFAKRRSILYHYPIISFSKFQEANDHPRIFNQISFFKLIQLVHESFKRNKGKTKKNLSTHQTISHNFARRKRICTTGQAFFFLFRSKNLLAAFFCQRGSDTRSGAIREHRHLARFLLSANETGKRLCPTGVVKPVPSTRNEHSLLFTVHQASRAPPDDVPINVHDCVYQRGQTFLIRPQHGSLDFYSADNTRFYEARVPRF